MVEYLTDDDKFGKYHSRKWILILTIFGVATLGVFAPPMISSWIFKATEPLTIVSGTEFVSLITLIITAYFGFNVWQKKVEGQNSLTFQTNVDPNKPNAAIVEDTSDDESKED
jgi:hypothetical protein